MPPTAVDLAVHIIGKMGERIAAATMVPA